MADPDQTASDEAVWSGSFLFAILTSILWILALKTYILFQNRKRKVFEVLEHLPYNVWYMVRNLILNVMH